MCGMLKHEFSLHFLKGGIVQELNDEILFHFLAPPRVFLSSSVMFVGHVSFFESVHDGLQQLHGHFLLGLFGGNFVCQFDEPVEVVGLSCGHPAFAVD